ncbi:conserved hypothetical protein [Gammaproteobacteria bacterium]
MRDPKFLLPSTQVLLTSGGDDRILIDPISQKSRHGISPIPNPRLTELGSSTASTISKTAFLKISILKDLCEQECRHQSESDVYASHMERIRSELFQLIDLSKNQIKIAFAASGTDVHAIVSQWIRPEKILSISAPETGNGLPLAVQGKHFSNRTAYASNVEGLVSDWRGEWISISAREDTGKVRNLSEIDDSFVKNVTEKKKILLILTDVSKTGLLVPSVEIALTLKEQWKPYLEILVDACQCRLAPETIQAYLSSGCMVAITGSKFISGPMFCGALLIPEEVSNRYWSSFPTIQSYSSSVDWPFKNTLPNVTNFGLLLRWEAALEELRRFCSVPTIQVQHYLKNFSKKVLNQLYSTPCLEVLPVLDLQRKTLYKHDSWDTMQTIFPFLIRDHQKDFLDCIKVRKMYENLQHLGFQLGQPVICGQHKGHEICALRICVSARMIANADINPETIGTDAISALDAIQHIISDGVLYS